MDWLYEASRLYGRELGRASGNGRELGEEMSKREIKRVAEGFKKAMGVADTKDGFKDGLRDGYWELEARNKYYGLMVMVEKYQLEELTANLEYILSKLDRLTPDPKSQA